MLGCFCSLKVSCHQTGLKKKKKELMPVLVIGGIIFHLLINSLPSVWGAVAVTFHHHSPIYFVQSLLEMVQLWGIKEKQFAFDFSSYETVYSEKCLRGTLSSMQMLFMRGGLTEIATETENSIYPGSLGLSAQKCLPPSLCFSGGPHWQIWKKHFHGNKVQFI